MESRIGYGNIVIKSANTKWLKIRLKVFREIMIVKKLMVKIMCMCAHIGAPY